VSAPEILASMAHCWAHGPASLALGTERSGISAALWTGGPEEVEAEPDLTHHTLSLQLAAPRTDVFVDGRRVFGGTVPRHSCQLMASGSRPRGVFYEDHSTLHLYIPVELVGELIAASGLAAEPNDIELIDPACIHDPIVERIGREVLHEMGERQPLSRLRVDALGQELAIQLLRAHSSLTGTRALSRLAPRGGLAPWQVRRATDYLMARLDENVSLADLAASVRLSPFHFARAFKRAVGIPPQRFLMERRVQRAKELLTSTSMELAEIALACGFAGQSHFTTAFKRHTGVTPGVWRAAVRH